MNWLLIFFISIFVISVVLLIGITVGYRLGSRNDRSAEEEAWDTSVLRPDRPVSAHVPHTHGRHAAAPRPARQVPVPEPVPGAEETMVLEPLPPMPEPAPEPPAPPAFQMEEAPPEATFRPLFPEIPDWDTLAAIGRLNNQNTYLLAPAIADSLGGLRTVDAYLDRQFAPERVLVP